MNTVLCWSQPASGGFDLLDEQPRPFTCRLEKDTDHSISPCVLGARDAQGDFLQVSSQQIKLEIIKSCHCKWRLLAHLFPQLDNERSIKSITWAWPVITNPLKHQDIK